MRLVLLCILLALPAASRAKQPCGLDSMALIPSFTDNSALSAECRLTGDGQAHCRFVEVTLRQIPSEQDLDKARRDDLTASRDAGPRMWAEARRACDSKKKKDSPRAWLDTALANNKTPEKQRAVRRSITNLDALCACKTEQCMKDELLRAEDEERKTCKVWSQTFELDFKKTGPSRWVSTDGPKGTCDVVEVTSIDLDDQNSCLPTVTWVRASANTNAGPLCKGLQLNVPSVWSWRAGRKMLTSCESLEFGL